MKIEESYYKYILEFQKDMKTQPNTKNMARKINYLEKMFNGNTLFGYNRARYNFDILKEYSEAISKPGADIDALGEEIRKKLKNTVQKLSTHRDKQIAIASMLNMVLREVESGVRDYSAYNQLIKQTEERSVKVLNEQFYPGGANRIDKRHRVEGIIQEMYQDILLDDGKFLTLDQAVLRSLENTQTKLDVLNTGVTTAQEKSVEKLKKFKDETSKQSTLESLLLGIIDEFKSLLQSLGVKTPKTHVQKTRKLLNEKNRLEALKNGVDKFCEEVEKINERARELSQKQKETAKPKAEVEIKQTPKAPKTEYAKIVTKKGIDPKEIKQRAAEMKNKADHGRG